MIAVIVAEAYFAAWFLILFYPSFLELFLFTLIVKRQCEASLYFLI